VTLPFLSTLTRTARRAFPIIQGAVRRGLSANRIQSLLSSVKLGIRRTSLLDLIRREKGIEIGAANLRAVRRDRIPDPRRMPEALTTLKRAFSFKVRLQGIDTSTGEDIDRFVQVSLDRPRTRGDIEDLGASFAFEDPERYGIDLTSVTLQSGVKAGFPGTIL